MPPSASKKSAPKFPVRLDSIIARTNPNGSTAIINLDSDNRYYTLDLIAAQAWQLFDGKHSVEQIVKVLAKKNRASEGYINAKLKTLLQKLKQARLIRY